MVHTLNSILLTSTELFELRNQLKELKTEVIKLVIFIFLKGINLHLCCHLSVIIIWFFFPLLINLKRLYQSYEILNFFVLLRSLEVDFLFMSYHISY